MLDLKDIAEPDIKRNVMAQAALRLKLGVPVGLIAIGFKLLTQTLSDAAATPGFTVIAGYILYVGAIWVVTRFKPSWLSWQVIAVTTAALDPFVLSAWLFVEGQHAVIVIGFLLFSILGFGFRLGRPIMHFCQSIAVACFLVVMTVSDYWSQHTNFAFSHLVLLLVVPVYAGTLIRDFQRAKTQAEEDSRAKSRLLANVSHELRTPLTGIVAAAELLGIHVQNPKGHELLTTISGLSRALEAEIDQLLDMSSSEHRTATRSSAPFNLPDILHQVAGAVSETATRKGLAFSTDLDTDIIHAVVGHESELSRVLINLAGNAVKFTEAGEVNVYAHLRRDTGHTYIIEFGVADTGIGIPKEHLHRIFEPFFQVHSGDARRYGGTGLGTTIARESVRRMGSELKVDSTLGKGTRFWFMLELEYTLQSAPAPVEIEQVTVPPMRVLVVDDNKINLNLIRGMLERDGHRVSVASSGRAALDQLAIGTFDALMIDFNLGDMDGLEVFEIYRMGRIECAPAFFVTADTTASTETRLREAGAAGIIHKPVTFATIRRALISAGSEWVDEKPTPVVALQENGLSPVPTVYVDPSILETLREIKDSPVHIYQMIDDGRSDLSHSVELLSNAIRRNDVAEVHHIAHAVRGVALNLGCMRLAARCGTLMTLPRIGLETDVANILKELKETAERTFDALDRLKAPFSTSAQA